MITLPSAPTVHQLLYFISFYSFIVFLQAKHRGMKMRDKLTEIGCVWARRIKAILNGKIFYILLGYIINEEHVALPYAAIVDARLSPQELQDLKESLRLSQPVTIGEYNNEWQWRTWNGAPIDALPSIESPHQIMNRAADINMVFIELFTSLKELKPSILREVANAGLLTRIYLYQQNKADRWQDLKECPHKRKFFTFYREMNV